MKSLSFLSYSDIHHHQFDNGLTLEDSIAIEDQVIEIATQNNVDAILFGGDTYLLRNPPFTVRAAGDRALVKQAKRFRSFRLLGNHDREAKNAHSGHAAMHLREFQDSLKMPVTIMDQCGTYYFDDESGRRAAIHAYPAGHDPTTAFVIDPNDINICVFHDMLIGSWQQNAVQALHGLDPSLFDRAAYDLVLGGDNHVQQKLNFVNTQGWYIGAPMQHNWGDAGQDRGFLLCNIAKDGTERLVTVTPIKALYPQFVKYELSVSSMQEIDDIVDRLPVRSGISDIYSITLKGNHDLLSKVKLPKLQDKWVKQLKARSVMIVLEPVIVFKELIPELKRSKTPEDDWKAFVNSGKLDLDGMPPDQIIAMGLEVLHNVR
jgi:DNA repair exonuclease SbcCD nuclease subunit